MAWIRKRRRKDGGMTYEVKWREPGDEKESSLSIKDDLERAKMNVRLLDANGQSFAAAKRAQEHARIGGSTVHDAIGWHIDLLTNAGPDSIARYRSALKNHFSGDLGRTPLAAVEQEDVIRWIKYMQGKQYRGQPFAPKTIANHHGLLSAALDRAGNLPASHHMHLGQNPCKGIDLPKDDRTDEVMRFMTVSEVSLIVDKIRPEWYRPFVAFLLATGMRFGEATALRSSDFNLDSPTPTVRVERAWKRNGGSGFYLGPPKTKKSRRSISLPPSIVEQVRPMVEASVGKDRHIFATSTGSPIRHSTFHDYWTRALDELGYESGAGNRPRIHDLRHTHASLMLAAGLPIYDLSRRLGHESIQTTIDRYSHLMPDAHFRGAEIAAKALAA